MSTIHQRLARRAKAAVKAMATVGPVVPQGWVLTSMNGFPVMMPTMASFMAGWVATVENQSILSLDNQGDNSPAALYQEAIGEGQDFILAQTNAPVPDANPATALIYAGQLATAAGFVPSEQWNPETYDYQAPGTILEAVAAKFPPPPPPPPPPSNVLVQACYQVGGTTICYPGPGVTNETPTGFTYMETTYQNGSIVADQSSGGTKYQAVYTAGMAGIGGEWSFVQVAASSAPKS